MLNAIQRFYDKVALDFGNTIDELMFGKIKGYRKKRVTKYLHIPIPYFAKYHDDWGDFQGYLFNFYWKKTPIPIGKEIIEVPIRQKPKGTIKFRRYGSLDEL